MQSPSWETITIEQYQKVYQLTSNEKLDEVDLIVQLISILYGMTDEQIESLSVDQLNKLAKKTAFVFDVEQLKGKHVDYIKGNGNEYKVNYQINKLRFGQYVELNHFIKGDVIENLHYIMASIVDPVKKVLFYRWKVKINDSKDHENISKDMLQTKFIHAYHSALFFYQLFTSSIRHTQDYLIQKMREKGMTMEESNTVVKSLLSSMDGFITQRKLKSMKDAI